MAVSTAHAPPLPGSRAAERLHSDPLRVAQRTQLRTVLRVSAKAAARVTAGLLPSAASRACRVGVLSGALPLKLTRTGHFACLRCCAGGARKAEGSRRRSARCEARRGARSTRGRPRPRHSRLARPRWLRLQACCCARRQEVSAERSRCSEPGVCAPPAFAQERTATIRAQKEKADRADQEARASAEGTDPPA